MTKYATMVCELKQIALLPKYSHPLLSVVIYKFVLNCINDTEIKEPVMAPELAQ